MYVSLNSTLYFNLLVNQKPPTPFPTSPPTSPPSFDFIIDGKLVITADICSLTPDQIQDLMDDITKALSDEVCLTTSDDTILSCSIIVEEPDCSSSSITRLLRRGRALRHLSGSFELNYQVLIEAICNSACSNAETVADDLYTEITSKLQTAISDDTLLNAIITASSGDSEVATLLQAASVTGDFAEVVIPILDVLSEYYPDWAGTSETCKNDGKAPRYMKKNGGYFESSLKACCERWYNWDVYTCMGATQSVEGFYPNWGHSESKCINATEDTPPGYMLNNPSLWLYDDLDDCCSNY